MNETKTIPVYDFQKFSKYFESEDFELFLGDFAELISRILSKYLIFNLVKARF